MNLGTALVWILLSFADGETSTKLETFPTEKECNRVLNLIHEEYPGKRLMCVNTTIVVNVLK
ncbi:hypothetical protein JCM14076_06580 [Methylosoma difficile]